MTARSPIDVPVVPLMIGPRNCENVLGVPWRWARDHARRLGVSPISVAGKSMFPAAALIEALKREGARTQPAPVTEIDELAAMRARLRGAG